MMACGVIRCARTPGGQWRYYMCQVHQLTTTLSLLALTTTRNTNRSLQLHLSII